MATTPQGDDSAVRAAVMHALAKQVARRQIAANLHPSSTKQRPKKLTATFVRKLGPASQQAGVK